MPEELCEQCGQPLVPNARFCTACGWETGSQATLPLPQGMTGNHSGSGYPRQNYPQQNYPQQGEPTPLEEFEQEFERQSTYDPAYDPYDQYGSDSYSADDSYSAADAYADSSDGGLDNGTGRNDKKKRNSAKSKTTKNGAGQTATKRATGKSARNTAGTSTPRKTVKSRKHPVTAAAIAILACIVVVFSGIGIVRMTTSDHGTDSDSSSTANSNAASGNARTGNGTAGQGDRDSKRSGKSGRTNKSSATGTTSQKSNAQQQDPQPSAGGIYTNARFGYEVTIPDGFTWQAESANGDGRSFTNSRTGMTIAAWGSNNAANETATSAFMQATAGHSISYQQILGSEFTATWEENGTITYIREMVSNGAIRAVQFTYPSAQRDECDRIVEQVVPTLTATGTAAGSEQQ